MKRHEMFSFWSFVASLIFMTASFADADPSVHLVVLDPGHFHAGLIHRSMYPQISPEVHVYAPAGPELEAYKAQVALYNSQADKPTSWKLKVYEGPDYLDQMARVGEGNVVVIAGNNARKIEYIRRAVEAGFHVFADKPMALNPADFEQLRGIFDTAARKNVMVYDIMTERSEITTIIQQALARNRPLFGTLQTGSPTQPAVEMKSVHHYSKEVAGKQVIRPDWYFDVGQQGEAIPDVGTHLADLVQWMCFPDQVLDWQKHITVTDSYRWPTFLSPPEFLRVTGLLRYPEFLRPDVSTDDRLSVFQNGFVSYILNGVHIKLTVRWDYKAPPGAGDTHYSRLRGTGATLTIKQGPEQNHQPTLYVENTSGREDILERIQAALGPISMKWPDTGIRGAGEELYQITIPEKYTTGHEAHFAEVMERFLGYLAAGKMPDWEVPNMLAKYYTTTQAYRVSHGLP